MNWILRFFHICAIVCLFTNKTCDGDDEEFVLLNVIIFQLNRWFIKLIFLWSLF